MQSHTSRLKVLKRPVLTTLLLLFPEKRLVNRITRLMDLQRVTMPGWYESLGGEIKAKYPKIPFEFPDMDKFTVLVARSMRNGPYSRRDYKNSIFRECWIVDGTAVETLVAIAKETFLEFQPPMPSDIYPVDSDFEFHHNQETDPSIDRTHIFELHNGRCLRCGVLLDERFFQIHQVDAETSAALCGDCHALMDYHPSVLKPKYVVDNGKIHEEDCRHIGPHTKVKQVWGNSNGFTELETDPPSWLVRKSNTRQKDWQLTTNCKVCNPSSNREVEYPLYWDVPFPNTLIGIEKFIEDFGDNYVPGFRKFKTYRGPFVPFMCGTSNYVPLERP